MPPAFILSQDQTLHNEKPDRPTKGRCSFNWFYAQKKGVGGISSAALRSIYDPRPSGPGSRILQCDARFSPPRQTARRTPALRCPVSKEPSPASGQRVFNLALFPPRANRLDVFFGFFTKKVGSSVNSCAALSHLVNLTYFSPHSN